MPDIPNLPGVPSLSSFAGDDISLLVGDAITSAASLLGIWGIFVGGIPVIIPASQFTQSIQPILSSLATIGQLAALIGLPNIVPCVGSMIEFDFSGDTPISNYPQEQGAFQSYDKVVLPYDVKVKIACSGNSAQRQAFFSTLNALRTSTALVDLVTPDLVYTSLNCKHVSYPRSANHGVQLVVADVWFEQIPIVSSLLFTNVANAAMAGPAALGNVQPQAATGSAASAFAGLGGAPF